MCLYIYIVPVMVVLCLFPQTLKYEQFKPFISVFWILWGSKELAREEGHFKS